MPGMFFEWWIEDLLVVHGPDQDMASAKLFRSAATNLRVHGAPQPSRVVYKVPGNLSALFNVMHLKGGASGGTIASIPRLASWWSHSRRAWHLEASPSFLGQWTSSINRAGVTCGGSDLRNNRFPAIWSRYRVFPMIWFIAQRFGPIIIVVFPVIWFRYINLVFPVIWAHYIVFRWFGSVIIVFPEICPRCIVFPMIWSRYIVSPGDLVPL